MDAIIRNTQTLPLTNHKTSVIYFGNTYPTLTHLGMRLKCSPSVTLTERPVFFLTQFTSLSIS